MTYSMTQKTKKSYCHLCLAHCGIKISIENDVLTKVVSDFEDPVSQGYICEKAQKLIGHQYHSDRITTPMKKIDGKYVPISMEQAIDEIATKLRSIRADRILYMAPAVIEYKSVYKYELVRKLGAKFVTDVFSMEKMYPELVKRTLLHTHAEPDRTNSQVHIIVGQNPWVTHHFARARKILLDIKNNPDRKLIVIDPCDTDTTKISDIHLKTIPGSDAWVMTALIKILIDNNQVDLKFINEKTKNYDKVLNHFSQVDLDECLTICGLSYDQLSTVANLIHQAKGVSISSGNGICHTPNALANNYLFCLLYLLTGNYQKSGGMNTVENSINQCMVGEHYFTETSVPWGNQKQIAGVTSASFIVDNLYIDEDRHFDCVFIDNNNPVSRFPDSDKLISQLNKVGLVIALDSFNTQSTAIADYILPLPTFFETYEISAVDGHIGRLSEPIISTDQISAERIYESLLEKLNLIDHVKIDNLIKQYKQNKIEFFNSLEAIYKNKDPIVYYILYRTVGLDYKDPLLSSFWWKVFLISRSTDSIEQSIKIADSAVYKMNTEGWAKVNVPVNTSHDLIDLTGVYLLKSLKTLNLELTNTNFKFILQCGYRQKDTLNGIIPNTNIPTVEVSTQDLKSLSIADGENVILQTETAEVQIKCKAVDNLQSGLIRIPNHAIINKLSNTKNRDYLNPQYKLVFANIRKINGTS